MATCLQSQTVTYTSSLVPPFPFVQLNTIYFHQVAISFCNQMWTLLSEWVLLASLCVYVCMGTMQFVFMAPLVSFSLSVPQSLIHLLLLDPFSLKETFSC